MANIPTGGDDTLIEEEEIIQSKEEIQNKDDLGDDTDTGEDEGDDEESAEALKARLKKAEELARNQRIRAEKAESKLKGDTHKEIPSSKKESSALSNSDIFTLVKANVPEEDVEDVQKYAKMNNLSIKDALNSNFMKSYLSNKASERATAEATYTGAPRKTSSKKTGGQLLSEAQSGNLPDDPMELAKAREQARLAKKGHRTR